MNNKVNVHPFLPNQQDLARLIGEYFSIAHWDEINAIKIEIFHPLKNLKRRKEAFKKFYQIISALKPKFKAVVIERNRLAVERGFKNQLEFALNNDGVTRYSLDFLLENADSVIKQINNNIPFPKNLPNWYWSELNIPDFLYGMGDNYKFHIPNDVYRLVQKFFPKIKEFTPNITVKGKRRFRPYAKYSKETHSVLIETPTTPSIYSAFSFVHELGHAISFLKLAREGINPYTKSKYWHEKKAYKFKFMFEELALPEKVKNASRAEILSDLDTAFFEYDIYTNPHQDFDKAYAQAINRCYPGKPPQKVNPFYVLENSLVFRPCSVVTAAIVQTELLAKNSKYSFKRASLRGVQTKT